MNNKYKIRKFKCIGCGKETEKRRSVHHTKYCSLSCYRKSKRPQRVTGKTVSCNLCGKEVYKKKYQLKQKNVFCSANCANKFQARNKLTFICKICGKQFRWSKSRITQANPTYCSWKCRLKDKENILKNAINGNIVQQRKKGLNKLELKGRQILKDIGLKFNEQVLMFGKFLVDVVLKNKQIIIQWDGVYWHTKPKRMALDKSQDAYLRKCGYKILRITDYDIKNNRKKVYAKITAATR